jgi:hypothetical protein
MNAQDLMAEPGNVPHCDQAVLHAPGECQYCDVHPEWQALRELWGVAFTGHEPTEHQVPCPSDARRGRGMAHAWGGNRPTEVDPGVPETRASQFMYGPTGREPQRSFLVWTWRDWLLRRRP